MKILEKLQYIATIDKYADNLLLHKYFLTHARDRVNMNVFTYRRPTQ